MPPDRHPPKDLQGHGFPSCGLHKNNLKKETYRPIDDTVLGRGDCLVLAAKAWAGSTGLPLQRHYSSYGASDLKGEACKDS